MHFFKKCLPGISFGYLRCVYTRVDFSNFYFLNLSIVISGNYESIVISGNYELSFPIGCRNPEILSKSEKLASRFDLFFRSVFIITPRAR